MRPCKEAVCSGCARLHFVVVLGVGIVVASARGSPLLAEGFARARLVLLASISGLGYTVTYSEIRRSLWELKKLAMIVESCVKTFVGVA